MQYIKDYKQHDLDPFQLYYCSVDNASKYTRSKGATKMWKYICLHGIDGMYTSKTCLMLEEKWPTPTKFVWDVSDVDLPSLSGEEATMSSNLMDDSAVSIAMVEEEWMQH